MRKFGKENDFLILKIMKNGKEKNTKKFTSDFPSIKIYFFMDNQIKENFYCLIF